MSSPAGYWRAKSQPYPSIKQDKNPYPIFGEMNERTAETNPSIKPPTAWREMALLG